MNKYIYGSLIAIIRQWKWLNRSCEYSEIQFFRRCLILWLAFMKSIYFHCDNVKTGLSICVPLLLFSVHFSSCICTKNHNIVARVVNQALHFQWFLFVKWRKYAQKFKKKHSPKICKCFWCSMTFEHQIFGSFWRSHVHHINFEFTQFGLMPTITHAHNSLGHHSIEL